MNIFKIKNNRRVIKIRYHGFYKVSVSDGGHLKIVKEFGTMDEAIAMAYKAYNFENINPDD